MTTPGPRYLPAVTSTKDLAATRETVFRALTDPAWITRWFGPDEARLEDVSVDLRVGGAYSIGMRYPDGSLYTLQGTYEEVTYPSRLSFTWLVPGYGSETLVVIDLEHHGDGTRLTVTHERYLDEEERHKSEIGWAHLLEKFARVVAGAQA